ncbi:hypothetical protein N7493_006860 [Penicillium malachiteum]|uniref:Nuclear GTPase SLIP-GC-like n=1 Tax=Penicillium malachiteum TaxID=1324776 RepID=A0AAD6MUZ1_9EURO|nr:hypothetical protein N7493_006860 [Penicillium malachiteum]
MDPTEPRKRIKVEEDETSECLDLVPYSFRQGNVSLQEALIELKELLQSLMLSMGLSEFAEQPNSNLHKLSKEIERLWNFQCSEIHILGFIGDSGVGKSSVINSLLDEKEIARSSGAGAACTSVVTEFRNVDNAHPNPYTIEIDFMGSEDIKELLEELLRNFRTYNRPSLCDQISSDEECDKAEMAATRAMRTLESLFHDKEELTPEFLGDESEDAWERIIKRLETWAGDVLARRPDQIKDRSAVVTTDDLQSCKDYLDFLMNSSHKNENLVLWPFINLIRVYLQSPVLESGLVVADLPGFRDMNYARTRATERYLFHQCDEVVIVTEIGRCVTDPSITKIRNRCSMKPQQIVCTKSEELSPDEEARGKTAHNQQVQSMNSDIEEIRDQLRATKARIKSAVFFSMRSNLKMEHAELMLELEELEFERTKYLMNHRNTHVEQQLKKKHNNAGVFCVSNKLYSENRTDEQSPYMALSGILELRQHFQRLPEAGQLRLLTAYLNNQIPSLLGSIRQWTLAGSDTVAKEQAEALQRSLKEVKETFHQKLLASDGVLKATKQALNNRFNEKVLQLIHSSTKSWTKKSEHISDKWAQWHHSTYAAFCRAKGTYTIKSKKEDHCWNSELIRGPQKKLKPTLKEITSWLNGRKKILNREISEVLEQACTTLQSHKEDAPVAIVNIIPNIDARKETLLQEVETVLAKMLKSIEQVSLDMCEGHASSFIATLMLTAYSKCADRGGPGSDKSRKKTMHKHIKHSGIFSKYERLAKNAFEDALQQHFDILDLRATEQIDGIIRDLSTIVVEQGKKSEAEQNIKLTDEIILRVEEAKRVLETAQEALEKGKNFE